MQNDITIYQAGNIDSLIRLADMVKNAVGMIPKAFLNDPAKLLVSFIKSQELGVNPITGLGTFSVVDGKAVSSYDFWVARLRQFGYEIEWKNCSIESATLILTSPRGYKHEETWNKERAQRAGLWNGKDNWKKHPETMLKARCVTSAGRAFAAEVMLGCYDYDEAEEIEHTAAAPSQIPAAAISSANGKRGAARVQAMLEASEEPTAETAIAVEEPQQPAEVSLAEIAREIATRAKARGWTLEDMQFAQESVGITPPKKLAECNADELRAISNFMGGVQ